MSFDPANPLIVQSDRTLLLEVEHPLYQAARDELARFAELEKSPDYYHTYRLSPLSLWNAAAAGVTASDIVASLEQYTRTALPANILHDIRTITGRYGLLKLVLENNRLLLQSDDTALLEKLEKHPKIAPYVSQRVSNTALAIDPGKRGVIKQVLIEIGYPTEDLAGYLPGDEIFLQLRPLTLCSKPFGLRDYQRAAANAFYAEGNRNGGSGVVVLPCGAGKTLVGIAALEKMQCHTLILTPSGVSVQQWIVEILDKTSLTTAEVGEYKSTRKEIKPVTVATYQLLTHRTRNGTGEAHYPHLQLLTNHNWGLIIYDEVHLLPAPVFRITTEIQAKRRLGLTATLVREDGLESDVFALIGPKKFDLPWRTLEKQGWIATANCFEVRTELTAAERMEYITETDARHRYRLAALNPLKLHLVNVLLKRHAADNVLVIGHYLEQLEAVAAATGAPLITGKMPQAERLRLYAQFRQGLIKTLVVSRVANFAVDLPGANVAIEISGLYGSRQEEAQRLGRILRPKPNGAPATFYSLVTRDTADQDFAARRQRFLTEQGYRYTILDGKELLNNPGF